MERRVKPESMSEELWQHVLAAHGPVNGMHTHHHSTYGTQGELKMHEHMHRHDGDSNHGHHEAMAAAGWPNGQLSLIAASGPEAWADAGHAGLASLLAAAHATVTDGGSLVAAAMTALNSPWGVEEQGEGWVLLGKDGPAGTFVSYQDAVDQLGSLAFVDASGRPVREETWRSDMAFEDVETGDGRYIAPGALQYRDCPLPLMLQTTTDVGHFGAVLAGTIRQCGTVAGVARGVGEFDDNDAGEQCVNVIQARSQFGVSIDGMSPAESEFECTQRDDEDGSCIDGRIRFTLLTVGGLTMTPFPAFADAFIALENRSATASGAPEPPCEDCDEPNGEPIPVGKEEPMPVGKEEPLVFTAAGGPDSPPAEWFSDPGFAVGDGRVVRQPNGAYACPLTVTADGRVFGHMAAWRSCHTGYATCVAPPRSKTKYAAFNMRPMMCADGSVVHVGHLSMGCGHASTSMPMTPDQVRDHYDGGPGAVRMASVVAGEDEFGIWFAGALNPGVTDDQVRAFTACSVSGDWREVWRGKGLDLVACLAGVTSPGFPIAAALAAAGMTADPSMLQLGDPVARWFDGRAVALVAAGVVRQPFPWERAQAEMLDKMTQFEERLSLAEIVTSQHRTDAVDRLIASTETA